MSDAVSFPQIQFVPLGPSMWNQRYASVPLYSPAPPANSCDLPVFPPNHCPRELHGQARTFLLRSSC